MSTQNSPRPPRPTTGSEPTAHPAATINRSGNRVGMVTMREIWAKLTDRAFVGGTLVSVLMILALVGLQIFLGHRTHTTHVAVTDPTAASMARQVGSDMHDSHKQIEVVSVTDDDAARQAVRSGRANVWLQHTGQGWSTVFKNSQDDGFVDQLRQTALQTTLATNAQRAGTSIERLSAGSRVMAFVLEGSNDRALFAKVLGFVFAILFFMSALGSGMQIAQSVAEEKQSRVIEILASAVPIPQLLAGKVLGNSVLALGQMMLYAVIGLIGTTFTSYDRMLAALSSSIIWYLAFFLAGFLALACIWAGAGAMVSRQEDLQSTTMPLMMILMAVYIIGFSASGTFQVIMSFVPIASAVLMPSRIAAGTAPWWQALLALLLNLAFAGVTVLVGARIYRRGLLRTNGRMTYREALQGE